MSSQGMGWPALAASGWLSSSGEIHYERGIWGKAHTAASDFRWLARSPGLDTDAKPELEVSSGLENLPADSGLWRSAKQYAYAAHCYQSRALDRAGRSSFLEKQILQWKASASVPRGVAALMLLEAAGRLDDSDWWAERSRPGWRDPSFALELASGTVPWDEVKLSQLVEQSLQELKQHLEDPPALTAFYAGLLSNRRPALLEGLKAPLPPLALAALLLPLPCSIAQQTSLLGWLLSSRFDTKAFADRWSGLACSQAPQALQSGADLSPQAQQLGLRCARAVLDGDTEALSGLDWPAPQRTPQSLPELSPAKWQPPQPSNPGHSQADLRQALQIIEKGGDWDQLKPHLAGLPPALIPLLQFSLDPKRWWTTPQALLGGKRLPRLNPDNPPLKLIQACLKRIEQERENGEAASPKQWSIKADILRAACLALSPDLETLRSIGCPRYRDPSSGICLVPPLLFVPWLEASWHPSDDWEEAVRLSRECPYPEIRCRSHAEGKKRASLPVNGVWPSPQGRQELRQRRL